MITTVSASATAVVAASPVSCRPVASNTCVAGVISATPSPPTSWAASAASAWGTSQTSSIEIGRSVPVNPSAEAVMVVVMA